MKIVEPVAFQLSAMRLVTPGELESPQCRRPENFKLPSFQNPHHGYLESIQP